MSQKIKVFYDSLYAEKPNIFGTSSVDFLAHVLDSFPAPSGVALDIGAGQGLSSNILAERGFSVKAIDISEQAFQNIKKNLNIQTFITPIEEFKINESYTLVHTALLLHHLPETKVISFLKSLKINTLMDGLHIFRLFTTNSDFFRQSQGLGFYDDGTNLNAIYKDWDILFDEKVESKAATQSAQNEVRQVVFKRIT